MTDDRKCPKCGRVFPGTYQGFPNGLDDMADL